jgi:glycosyltransferase involved in cell wall biosynthesis
MGHLHDDFTLAALYSAADVLVIPSRQESLSQTGTEAHACGCPVVAFDATGLKDVVANEETGLLVKPYDPTALASAIVLMLENDEMRRQFGVAARERAQRLWSYHKVAEQYKDLYEAAITH